MSFCCPFRVKVRPHGRTFVRRCPRTKVRVRLTFTSYSYFCTMLKFFCPNGRTQHIISVVYEIQCASDFSMKGRIFVQNIEFLFYIPTLVFLCDCFFSISGCDFMWFSRFFAQITNVLLNKFNYSTWYT